ncbi:hypothetical protein GCM10007880_47770 [Mesorhizobium amorphae]|nr:hypothetical protein GCM10007880_47770 [Mesorhizobium amorphae]
MGLTERQTPRLLAASRSGGSHMAQDIETIGIADLFGPPSPERELTDAAMPRRAKAS